MADDCFFSAGDGWGWESVRCRLGWTGGIAAVGVERWKVGRRRGVNSLRIVVFMPFLKFKIFPSLLELCT